MNNCMMSIGVTSSQAECKEFCAGMSSPVQQRGCSVGCPHSMLGSQQQIKDLGNGIGDDPCEPDDELHKPG